MDVLHRISNNTKFIHIEKLEKNKRIVRKYGLFSWR